MRVIFRRKAAAQYVQELLAFVTPLIPYFASTSPGDPFNSHLAGYATGVFFLFVAAVAGLLAFAVYRVYLRGKNG